MRKIIFSILVIVGIYFILQKIGFNSSSIVFHNIPVTDSSLTELCPMLFRSSPEIHEPLKPFAINSIWNRKIPANATYVNVYNSIFGDPTSAQLQTIQNAVSSGIVSGNISAPWRVLPDIVTICYSNQTQPLTNIEQNAGWDYPALAQSTGRIQYKRNLSPNACGCVNWSRTGNNLIVLIDPITQLADLLVGGWRILDGPLLNGTGDGFSAHKLDIISGDGIIGYGRGSSLPALGGLIRPGEFNNGINHAVAITMPSYKFSSKKHFTWPAQTADSVADMAYLGDNTNYTMGVLLAIPPAVDINTIGLKTNQGLNFAKAAQEYGLYVVDASTSFEKIIGLAMEDEALRFDFGYDLKYDNINSNADRMSVDPNKIDVESFTADVIKIISNVSAVTSNTH